MLRSRTIREGTLGLFILVGLLGFGGVIFWLKGGNFKNNSYQITAEFEDAGGLREGAKVRYRGIDVGKIVKIIPNSNGVDIIIDIEHNLKIPNQVRIETNNYGLLGEPVIDIFPEKQLTTEAQSINPLSDKCKESKLILCDQEKIKGKTGVELVSSMTRLSELYSSPEFYGNLNAAAENTALAGKRIAALTDDLSKFSKDIKKDINKLSKTADAFTNTANVTTEQINKLGNNLSETSNQINLLVTNLNGVIDENKANLSQAITNVSDSSKQLSNLVGKLEFTVTEVNSTLKETDTKKIGKNLEDFSENLKQISESLNKPTNLVTLQQTLDSARVTFENTAKITSDLDELTGDPEFRNNVRKLVNGLSNLVSYSDSLEKQIELAKILEEANQIANNPSKQNSQKVPNKININEEKNSNDIELDKNE